MEPAFDGRWHILIARLLILMATSEAYTEAVV
jgi:hypothetical protein